MPRRRLQSSQDILDNLSRNGVLNQEVIMERYTGDIDPEMAYVTYVKHNESVRRQRNAPLKDIPMTPDTVRRGRRIVMRARLAKMVLRGTIRVRRHQIEPGLVITDFWHPDAWPFEQ